MRAELSKGTERSAEGPFERAFQGSLLRVLDGRGRADLRAALRLHTLARGDVVFSGGEPADTLFVVSSGEVELQGCDAAARAVTGELFGRDALVPGARRAGRAVATAPAVVLELPILSLRRALARAGAAELLAREENAARRRAWSSLVRATAFGRELHEPLFDELARAWHEETFERGVLWLLPGDASDSCWIVVRGLVELSEPAEHRASGDWVGLEAALANRAHDRGASALAEVTVLRAPGALLRRIAEQSPRALALLREQSAARAQRQLRLRALAGRAATRHAFHEIGRLESATSLLAIDLETCVRCGQCTSACADTHGAARFDRAGPKVRLNLRAEAGELTTRALILPNACQHCHDPTCLPECPTGAITRDASGRVLIRAELCTGCGACVNACAFDAIRLEPAASAAGSALVASKCDLCRGHAAPACVSVCPTGAMSRLVPQRDVAELSLPRGAQRAAADTRPGEAGAERAVGASLLRSALRRLAPWFLLPPLLALARFGESALGPGLRLVSGVLSGLLCLALVAHALLKRLPRFRAHVQRWSRGTELGLSPFVQIHALFGAAALALVLVHTGGRVPAGLAGALAVAFYLSCGSGVLGALVYRVLPARLTRWERYSAPAADRAREREELRQRWFDGVSSQNSAVKELVRRVLLPYAEAPFGALALALSGRTLGEEAAALERHVERLMGGRKSERLADTRALIETAVALRALGARRVVEGLLVLWVPCHLVLASVLVVLLTVHAVGALG